MRSMSALWKACTNAAPVSDRTSASCGRQKNNTKTQMKQTTDRKEKSEKKKQHTKKTEEPEEHDDETEEDHEY